MLVDSQLIQSELNQMSAPQPSKAFTSLVKDQKRHKRQSAIQRHQGLAD